MVANHIKPIVRAAACSMLMAAAVATVFMGVTEGQPPPAPIAKLQMNQQVYLNVPAPPDTIPGVQPDWDYFAWNTFVALNWPALEVVPNRYRGIPDTSKKFVYAKNSDLLVWETFKEKREVFNHPQSAGKLTWYSPIDYGPLRKGTVSVQGARVFHQGSGVSPNSLDETVEVKSQARELTLPDGTTNPLLKAIPPVVTPRVWRGQPTAKNPIVYEVKVNYDYFKYVVSKSFNVDNSNPNNYVAAQASRANIRLPYRTSSTNPPGPNGTFVLNYRAFTAADTFQAINKIYHGPQQPPPNVPLPPEQGSIQVKAAWIKLGGSTAKPEEFPTWHTAIAQNYISDPRTGNPVPSEPTLFGLVGLHIIQRIHATDPKNPVMEANPPGGTFIYATWEHDSIFNSPDVRNPTRPKPTYFYSNFFAGEALKGPVPKGFYPPLDQPAYPVVRQYPVLANTKTVTSTFHRAIAAANPKSVWLHYHLVGTQFKAVDVRNPIPVNPKFSPSPNDPTGIGQPVFMANLAIETNLGLQYFQGQPPTITVIDHWANGVFKNNTSLSFARFNNNVARGNKGFNMGGCMGCHGVAQSKGYGFSFVLLGGYLGAVTDTQEHFNQPGASP